MNNERNCIGRCPVGVTQCFTKWNQCAAPVTELLPSFTCRNRCGQANRGSVFTNGGWTSVAAAGLSTAYFASLGYGPLTGLSLTAGLFGGFGGGLSLGIQSCQCDDLCRTFRDCCADVTTTCPTVSATAPGTGLVFPVTFRFASGSTCNSARNCACNFDPSMPGAAFRMTFDAFNKCTNATWEGNTYHQKLTVSLDGAYDIFSYNDPQCRVQIKGTTTFTRGQVGRCTDGPTSCGCKFRIDDHANAVSSGVDIGPVEPGFNFPVKYTFVFGDKCDIPGRCGCEGLNRGIFPTPAWSVNFNDLEECTSVSYEGLMYYEMIVRRNDGLYELKSFQDQACTLESSFTRLVSGKEAGVCQDTPASPGAGRWMVTENGMPFPLLFQWIPLGTCQPRCSCVGNGLDPFQSTITLTTEITVRLLSHFPISIAHGARL